MASQIQDTQYTNILILNDSMTLLGDSTNIIWYIIMIQYSGYSSMIHNNEEIVTIWHLGDNIMNLQCDTTLLSWSFHFLVWCAIVYDVKLFTVYVSLFHS